MQNDFHADYEKYDREIQRLVICYAHASTDDKRVVWAVLNKYAPLVPDFLQNDPPDQPDQQE